MTHEEIIWLTAVEGIKFSHTESIYAYPCEETPDTCPYEQDQRFDIDFMVEVSIKPNKDAFGEYKVSASAAYYVERFKADKLYKTDFTMSFAEMSDLPLMSLVSVVVERMFNRSFWQGVRKYLEVEIAKETNTDTDTDDFEGGDTAGPEIVITKPDGNKMYFRYLEQVADWLSKIYGADVCVSELENEIYAPNCDFTVRGDTYHYEQRD